MVQVRVMDVRVSHRFVSVQMRMRLRYRAIVLMQMMLIVNMTVLMFEHFMPVLMAMTFRQMNPKADPHQQCR